MIEDFYSDDVVIHALTEMIDEGGSPFPLYAEAWCGKGRLSITEANFQQYEARGRRIKGIVFLPIEANPKEGDRVQVRDMVFEAIRVKAPGAGDHHLEADIIEA